MKKPSKTVEKDGNPHKNSAANSVQDGGQDATPPGLPRAEQRRRNRQRARLQAAMEAAKALKADDKLSKRHKRVMSRGIRRRAKKALYGQLKRTG